MQILERVHKFKKMKIVMFAALANEFLWSWYFIFDLIFFIEIFFSKKRQKTQYEHHTFDKSAWIILHSGIQTCIQNVNKLQN